MLLKDKISIVTGAAVGIGAGVAELFAQHGAKVFLVDIDGPGCEAAAERIRSSGGSAVALQADVSNREQVKASVDHVLASAGRIDVLVNNAGIYPRQDFLSLTEAEWDQMQNINLKSIFHWCQLVLPAMIARRSGKIVNMSSVTVFKGTERLSHYVSTKAGMIGLSRSIAREVGAHNVHINCITPGAIKTEGEAVVHTDPRVLADLQAAQCLDRRLLPPDVAGPCLFLASALSDGMTGQTLNVDGGLVMH
ncbi:MAG: SDR family NAD(P)-dependent oxidoreductase [Bryobacteraceae bacterium]